MKNDKEFIDGIYKKYDEYLKENQSKKSEENYDGNKFRVVPNAEKTKKGKLLRGNFVKLLSSAAVCMIVLTGVFLGNKKINDEPHQIKTETSTKISLNKIGNFDNFYKIVKANTKDTRSYELKDFMGATFDTAEATNSKSEVADPAYASDDYSKTNIQVENVDEADIVKTDGKYVYYVLSNKIIILDIRNREKLEKITEISFEDEDFSPSELYIYKDKLIVVGRENGYSRSRDVLYETNDAIYKKGIYRNNTEVIVYDISDIKEPEEVRKVKAEGNYVSSRMIDGNIYFVANKSIAGYDIVRNNIKDLKEDAYKPAYTDTAVGSSEKLIDFDRIYYFDHIETLNYLILCGFNVDNKKEADIETFMGAGENIYCSTENLYVIKSKYVYDAFFRMDYGQDTKILKFALNNGNIEFKAEANIEGGINNQFSMDENKGYFRIATTVGKTYAMDKSTSNSLYILDKDLKEVGRLDGIAKGEKIYSVRYAGDKAYVVTFKEIDPLFVIDLSDVKNPKILGKLKIPGYSTYLHPYDETHLIGFGYDTKPNASNTGVVNDGLKMTMFDITDFENPKEMFTVKIGDRNTSSPLTDNHKALLFSKEKNLIAFPIRSYKDRKTEYKAQVYDIDLKEGFTLRGEIEHSRYKLLEDYYYSSYNLNIERIIYSKDVFYTISKGMIKASDMDTLKEITKIEL